MTATFAHAHGLDRDAWDRLEGLVARVKYRPGWVVQPVPGELAVELFAEVQDVYNPERMTSFGIVQYVPLLSLLDNEQQFYRWLFHTVILECEHHEAAEWFTVDGARPFDPHKTLGGEVADHE